MVRERELTDRIEVVEGDFHALPHAGASFDAALFLESAYYTDDSPGLFAEMFRVIRPGGRIYAKDVFYRVGMSAAERAELAEFDKIYAGRTRALGEVRAAAAGAGFRSVRAAVLQVTMEPYRDAVWDGRSRPILNIVVRNALISNG